MLDTQHMYYDLKNSNYERIIHSLENTDWHNTINSRSINQSADYLQKSLLDNIHEWVLLRTFHNSTFPQWVSSSLKVLLVKKKQFHKLYRILGGYNRYLIFSQLCAQCKSESKHLYKNYLRNMQEHLRSNPKSFWEFVRSNRGISTIPDEVHLGEINATGDHVTGIHFYIYIMLFCKKPIVVNSNNKYMFLIFRV